MSSVYRPTRGELIESLLKRGLPPLIICIGLGVAVRFARPAGRPVWYIIAVVAGALAAGWALYGLFTAYRAVDRRQRIPAGVRTRNIASAALALLLVLTGLIAFPWHTQRAAERTSPLWTSSGPVPGDEMFPLGDRLYAIDSTGVDVLDRHDGHRLAEVGIDTSSHGLGITGDGDIAVWHGLTSLVYSGQDGHLVLKAQGGRVVAAENGTYVVQNCHPRLDAPPCTYTGYSAGGRARWHVTGLALTTISLLRTAALGPGLTGGYTPNKPPPDGEQVALPAALVLWESPLWSSQVKQEDVRVLDASTGHQLARIGHEIGSYAAAGDIVVRSAVNGSGCVLTAVAGASWTVSVPGCGSTPLRPMVVGDRLYATAEGGGIAVDMRTGGRHRFGGLQLRRLFDGIPPKVQSGMDLVGADIVVRTTAGGVTGLDAATGAPRWQLALAGVTRAAVGYGGVVVVSPAPARPLRKRDKYGAPGVVTVLQAKTGKVCARFEVSSDTGQTITPVGPGQAAVVDAGGVRMIGCRG